MRHAPRVCDVTSDAIGAAFGRSTLNLGKMLALQCDFALRLGSNRRRRGRRLITSERKIEGELQRPAGHRAFELKWSYVRNWHEAEAEGGSKPVRLCPCSSDVNLFSYGEGIVDFNTKIPDGALDLCMSQQSCAIIRILLSH